MTRKTTKSIARRKSKSKESTQDGSMMESAITSNGPSSATPTDGHASPQPPSQPGLTETLSTPLQELVPVTYEAPLRDASGKFLPGKSGNPAGRTTRNKLTTVKQELELAVRQNISPNQIAQIVHRMYELALMGSVGAAKLLLDKTISNARSEEEEEKAGGGITIKIENLTLDKREETVIDVTPTQPEEI